MNGFAQVIALILGLVELLLRIPLIILCICAAFVGITEERDIYACCRPYLWKIVHDSVRQP